MTVGDYTSRTRRILHPVVRFGTTRRYRGRGGSPRDLAGYRHLAARRQPTL